jgi:hypothetical protein
MRTRWATINQKVMKALFLVNPGITKQGFGGIESVIYGAVRL